MRSHFDFQVASLDNFQLPTLKQLIGHPSDSSLNINEKNIRHPSLSPPLSSNDNFLRRSFDELEVVDIPIQILDDNDDDPNKLLLLRVPQNKLNQTILHTVLKIKLIDPKSLDQNDSLELKGGSADTNFVTNELLKKDKKALKEDQEIFGTEKPIEFERSASTYRGRSDRKRLRIDTSLNTSTEGSLSSQSLPVAQTTQDSINSQSSTTVIQTTASSLPVNPRAADIERARRRRIRLNSSQVTTGPISNNPNSKGRQRPSRRRIKADAAESTTTIRITTSRGSTLPSATTPDFPRGFFLTKNLDGVSVTEVDKVSSVGIQSTDPSTVFTTEKTIFSTAMEPFTSSMRNYSESSTITPLIKDMNQESDSNFYVTTTDITQENEEVPRDRQLDNFSNPIETTTEISQTTKLNDVIDISTTTNREIESVTERAALPHRYLRKKIRKLKPVSDNASDLESSTTPSSGGKRVVLKKINIRYSTEATPDYTITNSDSSLLDSDSISATTFGSTSFPTALESTSFITSDPTNSITLATTESIFESIFSTSETPSTEEDLTDIENPNFKSEVTEASGLDTTTENVLLRNDDFIKPNQNFVESSSERSDSSTTQFYVDLQTESYDEFEKLNFEFKDTSEISDNDITTVKEGLTLSTQNDILNIETTPSNVYQMNDQNETSILITSTTSQSILPEANNISSQINNQISTRKPIDAIKVIDEFTSRTTEPTSNGRRRVLKRKRQRIDQKLDEKHMEVSKTEVIEVTLEKSKDESTTPATISSTNIPVTEKPTRKRVVVYRGTRRFSSKTTPSTTTVQSLSDTVDHQNQIAHRRRMKTVVRKRPKLPTAVIPELELNTQEDQSNRKDKDLSLDPEIKPLDDAEEAGSEIHVYRTTRRPGSSYHREPNRIRSRSSTHQYTTTTQPSVRRLGSSGRQSLHLQETTLPSKLNFATVDDGTVLLERLTRLEDQKTEMDDQANRAHKVVLEDPDATTEPGDSSVRTTYWRKISTTEMPKTLATAIPALRRRQGQKYFNKIVSQNLPQRPHRPAIIDYDYYEDEEVRFVGKPRLNGKLYVTNRGSINCLDQGNFPHPISCKKFITCARMVNGQVVGTEYTCPDKLSFDPIGGICNWSAGLGCKE